MHFAISPRLCAFLGGVVAQEVIKKTGKCSLLIRVADNATMGARDDFRVAQKDSPHVVTWKSSQVHPN